MTRMTVLATLLSVAITPGLGSSTAMGQTDRPTLQDFQWKAEAYLGPLITWSMATKCGHDVPKKLKAQALVLLRAAYGEEAMMVVGLVNSTVDADYAKLDPKKKRAFCREALNEAARYEDWR